MSKLPPLVLPDFPGEKIRDKVQYGVDRLDSMISWIHQAESSIEYHAKACEEQGHKEAAKGFHEISTKLDQYWLKTFHARHEARRELERAQQQIKQLNSRLSGENAKPKDTPGAVKEMTRDEMAETIERLMKDQKEMKSRLEVMEQSNKEVREKIGLTKKTVVGVSAALLHLQDEDNAQASSSSRKRTLSADDALDDPVGDSNPKVKSEKKSHRKTWSISKKVKREP